MKDAAALATQYQTDHNLRVAAFCEVNGEPLVREVFGNACVN